MWHLDHLKIVGAPTHTRDLYTHQRPVHTPETCTYLQITVRQCKRAPGYVCYMICPGYDNDNDNDKRRNCFI